MDTTNTKLYRAAHILMAHVLKYEMIMGELPNQKYLVVSFDVPCEFADHIINTVNGIRQALTNCNRLKGDTP